MEVLLQYWKQRTGPQLISLSKDMDGYHHAFQVLLAAENGNLPHGKPQKVELADYAPAAARLREPVHLREADYVFISDAELKLYVRFLDP